MPVSPSGFVSPVALWFFQKKLILPEADGTRLDRRAPDQLDTGESKLVPSFESSAPLPVETVDSTLPPDVFYVSLALLLRGNRAQVPAGKRTPA